LARRIVIFSDPKSIERDTITRHPVGVPKLSAVQRRRGGVAEKPARFTPH
jgi:hypothetical protein